jgi:Arc/MetJ-type ribon-helix-helix transcriptional regulator
MRLQLQLSKPGLEKFIDDQVKAGRFPSPEAVVEDALARMMEAEAGLTEEELDKLDAAEAEAERGDVVEWTDASAELRKKYLGQ